MSIILIESTINLLISSGEKEKVEGLMQKGEVKQTELGTRYLKITED
jgi:hypothetical protein